MKPFDLEKAKAGAAICTRDGRPAKFIAYVPEADESWRVVALVAGFTCSYSEEGYANKDTQQPDDLFMASVKREGWVNVYPTKCSDERIIALPGDAIFTSKDRAIICSRSDRIDTSKIEWEEE